MIEKDQGVLSFRADWKASRTPGSGPAQPGGVRRQAGRDHRINLRNPESAVPLVFERELQLRAIGDPPALVQVNVLLNDLSHPQIADRPSSSPDRLRRRVFP